MPGWGKAGPPPDWDEQSRARHPRQPAEELRESRGEYYTSTNSTRSTTATSADTPASTAAQSQEHPQQISYSSQVYFQGRQPEAQTASASSDSSLQTSGMATYASQYTHPGLASGYGEHYSSSSSYAPRGYQSSLNYINSSYDRQMVQPYSGPSELNPAQASYIPSSSPQQQYHSQYSGYVLPPIQESSAATLRPIHSEGAPSHHHPPHYAHSTMQHTTLSPQPRYNSPQTQPSPQQPPTQPRPDLQSPVEHRTSPPTLRSATSTTTSRTALAPEGQHRCQEQDCNARPFSTFGNLRRHIREQHGDARKHQCTRCGQVFTRSTARDNHAKERRCRVRDRDGYRR